ncbi:MAG: type II secretion system protein [Candidatus Rokuibacteriota bacterium]
MRARGFGLVEIVIVLAVVAIAGVLLYRYFGATERTVERFQEERPLAIARLAADQVTATTIRMQLQAYQVQHGAWPADKAAALAALGSPPRFQCAGNDFDYDPATGQIRLLVDDPARC